MFCKNCGKEIENNKNICEDCITQASKKGKLTFSWWTIPIFGLVIQFIAPLILYKEKGLDGEIIARMFGFVYASVQNVLLFSLLFSSIILIFAKILRKKIGFIKIFFIAFLLISIIISFLYIKGIQYEMR